MTLHPVALPAPCFVWQSMGKTPEVRVKQQLAPERNLASFYNLHNSDWSYYLWPVSWIQVRVWWKFGWRITRCALFFGTKVHFCKGQNCLFYIAIHQICLLQWSLTETKCYRWKVAFSRTHSRSHRFLPNNCDPLDLWRGNATLLLPTYRRNLQVQTCSGPSLLTIFVLFVVFFCFLFWSLLFFLALWTVLVNFVLPSFILV